MISQRIVPIVLVASLVLGVLVVPSALANPSVDAATWGAPGAPVEAAPGDTAKPLSVSIRNGDQNIYQNVRAQIGASGPLAPVPGGGDTATLAATFNPGDVFVAKFFVNVGSDARVGATYGVPLTIFWTLKGSTFVTSTTTSVPLQLTGRP